MCIYSAVSVDANATTLFLITLSSLNACMRPAADTTHQSITGQNPVANNLPLSDYCVVLFRCIHYSVQSAMTYFACKVTVEDAEAFKPGQAYVVGIATTHTLVCCSCLFILPANIQFSSQTQLYIPHTTTCKLAVAARSSWHLLYALAMMPKLRKPFKLLPCCHDRAMLYRHGASFSAASGYAYGVFRPL